METVCLTSSFLFFLTTLTFDCIRALIFEVFWLSSLTAGASQTKWLYWYEMGNGCNGRYYDLSNLSTFFLVVHILGGIVGLPILVLTILLKKTITRHPSLINLFITWIIYSVSYCLALFTGKSVRTLDGTAICKIQSALVHGAPTMSVSAGLVVVLQIYSTLCNPCFTPPGMKMTHSHLIPIILYPYIVFVIFTMTSVFIQLKSPSQVTGSNGLYCTVIDTPFSRFGVPLYSTIILVCIVCVNSAVLVQCYRMSRHICQAFPLAERRATMDTLSMAIRGALFSVYSVFCLSASITFLVGDHHSWPYMVQATLPLAAFIIFGTQRDLFEAWHLCKPHTPDQEFELDLPAIAFTIPPSLPSSRSNLSEETSCPPSSSDC